MLKTNYTTIKRSRVSPFAEVWECTVTQNKSLHATIELQPRQVITHFKSQQVLTHPNYLTVQISEDQHIMLDPLFLQWINHSCEPNVFFDTHNLRLIALKKIEREEEFSFFYPSTEWNMNQPFNCLCQSDNCLGYIQGAAHLPRNILTQYQLSEFIQKKLDI